jgi:hypothetical protein
MSGRDCDGAGAIGTRPSRCNDRGHRQPILLARSRPPSAHQAVRPVALRVPTAWHPARSSGRHPGRSVNVGVRRPAASSAGPASAVFMAIRPGATSAALPIGATTPSLSASMARGPGCTAAGDRPPAADQAARGSRRVPGAPRHAGRVDGRRRCTHPGRVTARGRVAVVSLAALLLLAAFALGRASTVAATRAEAPVASQAVVVQAGDTLWAIANRLAPGRDPRVTVEQIRRLNRLSRSTLMVGQTLAVPAG